MSSFIHIIYASVATQDFETAQLMEILKKAREANERLGLTGMLLYSDRSFFQVLEGEPAVVDQVYTKITLDKRHKNITLIIREPIARRSFESWSMGFSRVTTDELKHIDGLNDFFNRGSSFTDLGAGRSKKLLAVFAEGRWRAKLADPELAQV